MSNRFLPESCGRNLNRAHLSIYVLLTVLTTIGAITRTVARAQQDECLARNGVSYCYYGPNSRPLGLIAGPTICYKGYGSKESFTCDDGIYDATSFVLNIILVPILALVAIILFSTQCSYLWNEAQSQAYKLSGIMQCVALSTNNGQHQVAVPIATFNSFMQWAGMQQIAVDGLNSLPDDSSTVAAKPAADEKDKNSGSTMAAVPSSPHLDK